MPPRESCPPSSTCSFLSNSACSYPDLHSFPSRRSSHLIVVPLFVCVSYPLQTLKHSMCCAAVKQGSKEFRKALLCSRVWGTSLMPNTIAQPRKERAKYNKDRKIP